MCGYTRSVPLVSAAAEEGPKQSFQTGRGEVRTARALTLPMSAPPLYTPQGTLCTHQTLHPNSSGPPCYEMETL